MNPIWLTLVLTQKEFTSLLLWCIAVTAGFIILIILAKLLQPAFNRRVRKLQEKGMSLNDLKAMKEKDLITEEEYKHIQHSLTMALLSPEKPEEDEQRRNGTLTDEPASPSEVSEKQADMFASLLSPTEDQAPESMPIDIEQLYKSGGITPEEYEKIRDSVRKQKPKES